MARFVGKAYVNNAREAKGREGRGLVDEEKEEEGKQISRKHGVGES